MITNSIELKAMTKGLNLGAEVDNAVYFELHSDTVKILIHIGAYIDGDYYSRHEFVLPEDLPNVSMENSQFSLKDIETFYKERYDISNSSLQVSFESALYGGIFLYDNQGDETWELHGITKGYA